MYVCLGAIRHFATPEAADGTMGMILGSLLPWHGHEQEETSITGPQTVRNLVGTSSWRKQGGELPERLAEQQCVPVCRLEQFKSQRAAEDKRNLDGSAVGGWTRMSPPPLFGTVLSRVGDFCLSNE